MCRRLNYWVHLVNQMGYKKFMQQVWLLVHLPSELNAYSYFIKNQIKISKN